MKRCALILLLVSLATPAFAKTLKPVDWQSLAQCLPELIEVDGFTKEGIEGDSYPQPYASIYYTKAGDEETDEEYAKIEQSLSLSITDCANASEYLHSMLELSFMDTPVTVNGKYEGKRTLELNDYVIQCGYSFVVKKRYLVEVTSTGIEDTFDHLDKLITAIKLDRLETVK